MKILEEFKLKELKERIRKGEYKIDAAKIAKEIVVSGDLEESEIDSKTDYPLFQSKDLPTLLSTQE